MPRRSCPSVVVATFACVACAASHPASQAPPASAAPVSQGEALPASEIASVVNGAHDKVQGCLFLANSPESAGTIAIDFTVAPSGDVSDANVGEATFPDQPVIKCVLRQMQKLHFPTATAETPATWKFVFGHPASR